MDWYSDDDGVPQHTVIPKALMDCSTSSATELEDDLTTRSINGGLVEHSL